MREIKFRAWHEVNKAMVYFDKDKLCSDVYQQEYLVKLMRGDFGGVLMQFTGLKDKNGIEIYEGDIVKKWIYGWNDGGMGDRLVSMAVEYDESKARFINCIDVKRGLEVIGNIYENPELLNEQNN